MEKLSDEQRAMIHEAWMRAKARMALQQIQETGDSQRQQAARARMSGRTIDETGKDVIERQPEPEPIEPGWYWTGTHVVWVVGPTVNGRGVYFQTGAGPDWAPMRITERWQRVHETVKQSGLGFGWRLPAQTH